MASPDIQIVAVAGPETDGRNYLSFVNRANGVFSGIADRIRDYADNKPLANSMYGSDLVIKTGPST